MKFTHSQIVHICTSIDEFYKENLKMFNAGYDFATYQMIRKILGDDIAMSTRIKANMD
jgi:hypothetical protein